MDEKMEEALDFMMSNARKAISPTKVAEIISKMGLRCVFSQRETENCPWCGKRIDEESKPSFEDEEGNKFTTVPVIVVEVREDYEHLARELKEEPAESEIWVSVPSINSQALGAPFHSVPVSKLARKAGELILGSKFEPEPSPYIGHGKRASHITSQAVSALREHLDG